MSGTTVTLEDVLAAASQRAASLVPETSGYLALAVGDATARLPLRIEEHHVTLSTEGTVAVARSREVVTPVTAAEVLRGLLAKLLAASAGTMPSLTAAARPRQESERGVEGVVDEIEAALIPVNRAAARRALARLARETVRAKESGKLRAQRPKPVAVAAPKPRPAELTPISAEIEAPEATPSPASLSVDVELNDDVDSMELLTSGVTPEPVEVALCEPALTHEPDDETEVSASVAPVEPVSRITEPFDLQSSEDVAHEALTEPRRASEAPPPDAEVELAEHTSPAPLSIHVETIPMRFELGHAKLGVEAAKTPTVAVPKAAMAPAPVGIEPAATPTPAPAEREPSVTPGAAEIEPATALAAVVIDSAPADSALPAEPARVAAPILTRTPPAVAAKGSVLPFAEKAPALPFPVKTREPRPARTPKLPERPKDQADLGSSPKSDVDALLDTFGDDSALDTDLRAFAAGLKAIAGIDATALPPPVALAGEATPGPASADALTTRMSVPEQTPSATQAASSLPGSRLPEPRKPRRAGLALSLTLLLAGLVGTALVWQLRPAFFAGTGSGLVRAQETAREKAEAAEAAAPDPEPRAAVDGAADR